MYILNTTYKVQTDVHKKWLGHLAQHHIPAALNSRLIANYKVHHVMVEEDDGLTFAIQYHFSDESALLDFEHKFKDELDGALWNKFPNQFVFFTTKIKDLTA